jgi:hypothetical protein
VRSHAAALEDALKRLHYVVPVCPMVVFTNTEFEYLSPQAEIPVICSEYLINALLRHSLQPIVPDTRVLASIIVALHKEAGQGKTKDIQKK